MSFTS